MRVELAALAVSWGIVAGAALPACPPPTPPNGTPPVVLVGDASFLTPTRPAIDVSSDLAAHCHNADAGLVAVELAHARVDRAPVWDCLFTASGSVSKCGCP